MKEAVRFGFTLALICVIASGLLAGVNALTQAKVMAQVQAEQEAGMKEVLPAVATFEPVKLDDEILYYKGFDRDKKLIGVAFTAIAKGYSSYIETVVGMFKDGTINAIKVLSQNETPGIGTKVNEPAFLAQFANRKDTNGIQTITGATISSKAIIDSVNKKAQQIKELVKNE